MTTRVLSGLLLWALVLIAIPHLLWKDARIDAAAHGLTARHTRQAAASAQAPAHPGLLFGAADVAAIRARAAHPQLKAVAARVIARADRALTAPPIVPSVTGRGEPDPPGETKGIASARALQGRVIDLAMAFTLTGDRRYRDKAVALLTDALDTWRIWVDTAHQPPYDLMAGENAMTFGLAYDWLYQDLTPAERQHLREGAERRALRPYLDAVTRAKPMFWFSAAHNWNTVCNGGATVLALALQGESDLADRVLALSVPAMRHYWDHLKDDGGWDEGTGYWAYGHRYGLLAAEALKRRGLAGGADVFARPGVRATGNFPIVFSPGRTLAAGFGDSNARANDAVLYLLAREYRNADFVWYEDRETHDAKIGGDGWPVDALALLWRPVDEAWLPERQPGGGFTPSIAPVTVFSDIGWAMLAPAQPDPPFFLAFKNGSLAANHTHLDLNTLNLGVGDTMVLRELGSRPYPADYFGPKRYSYYEITTAGHNTVLVGGRGQTPGKIGRLERAIDRPDLTALVGVADEAYGPDVTRARRHVVFVDKRYWVLLDEVECAAPQPIELRFHSYGTIAADARGPWMVTERNAGVAIFSPEPSAVRGEVQQPAGWTRPVQVLSLQSVAPARSHAIVTVLVPRPDVREPSLPQVALQRTADRLTVRVDRDRVTFTRDAAGWHAAR